MDDFVSDTTLDPREAIAQLEQRIEELSDKLESCRKFMLAARTSIVLGAVLLAALLVGLIAPDPAILLAAIGAVLGGFVLLGSNRTTANEAAAERTAAEKRRSELIGLIELRIVSGGKTLH